MPDNYAYMVGNAAPYDLYVQVVPEGQPQQWLDAGQVEGVVGPQGPQGPQGVMGPTGAQGPAATIQVGNVTTLEPGQQATVTNSGTSGAAVFDFGIPKGEPGSTPAHMYAHQIVVLANDNYMQVTFTLFNSSPTQITSFSSIINSMEINQCVPASGGVASDYGAPVAYLYKTNGSAITVVYNDLGALKDEELRSNTSGYTISDYVTQLV